MSAVSDIMTKCGRCISDTVTKRGGLGNACCTVPLTSRT